MVFNKHILMATVASSVLAISGCKFGSYGYQVEIFRTEGGFPHIQADDFGSLGFGTGYAAAQDNICFLAEDFLKYNAEKSKYLGTGTNNANLNSDFFYQYLADTGVYDEKASPELEAIFAGYAAGYNRYLNDTGADQLPASCQSADWVKPIDADTIRKVHLTPYFLSNFAGMVTAARPPVSVTDSSPDNKTSRQVVYNTPAINPMVGNLSDKGSNGVAIGREMAMDANALLLANPHLTWDNASRFYPMHQVIPGVMNLLGANAINRAHVGFGTNGDVAWTNTVSTA